MPRIIKSESNFVSVQTIVSVTKQEYIYPKRTITWVDKVNGLGIRADHKKECNGKFVVVSPNCKSGRRMYANEACFKCSRSVADHEKSTAPRQKNDYAEYSERLENIAAGLHVVAKQVVDKMGLRIYC